MKGSLFNLMSPLLDLKYNESITEDLKLSSPKHSGSFQSYKHQCHPNIVPYFDKETLVFLYLDSKSKAKKKINRKKTMISKNYFSKGSIFEEKREKRVQK